MTQVQITISDMTLRDWFAGNALVALDYWSTRDKFPLLKDGLTYEQLIAHHAYAMADTLLAERAAKADTLVEDLAKSNTSARPEAELREHRIRLGDIDTAGIPEAIGAAAKRNPSGLVVTPL